VDPDSLNPDPAFQVNPYGIRNPDPDQKLKKKNTAKICFSIFNQKLQFTYIQATEALSSQRERRALQKMKFINFFGSGSRISGYGPRDLNESGSNLDMDPDPDPQYCL
jgi:hypothetical protein